MDWFGTVRARIGYVWGNGQVLSYVTGGLAYGEVKINGTNTINAAAGGATESITQAFGHSQVNTGWVVGYGTEGASGGQVTTQSHFTDWILRGGLNYRFY